MAITWGAWEYSGGNGMRLGLEATVSTVTPTSTSVTITWRLYTQNQYNYASDSQKATWSGPGLATSTTFTNTGNAGIAVYRGSATTSHTYTGSGGSPGTHQVTVTLSEASNGVTPSVTLLRQLPARSYALPAAPSALTAVRIDDTHAKLTWTNNTTSTAPYDSIDVFRKFGDTGNWVKVSTLAGSTTTWTDYSSAANQKVFYHLRANNSTGTSAASGVPAPIYNSPAQPTNVVAVRTSDGTVDLTWKDTTNYAANRTWRIERWDGAWTTVAPSIGYQYTYWTDPSVPPGNSYQYRVTGISSSGAQGPHGYSNAVSQPVPHLAPSNLAPNPLPFEGTQPATLTWQTNPGTDNAIQTAYKVRFRKVSAENWGPETTVVSGISKHTFPANTFANGDEYFVQVATRGVNGTFGNWSLMAAWYAYAKPTITITSPGTTVTEALVVDWLWAQANGLGQYEFEAELWEMGSTPRRLEKVLQASTASQWVPKTRITDGTTYEVRVRARSLQSVWSNWTTKSFTVDLLPPATVTLTATFHPDSGSVSVAMSAATATPGVTATVTSVVLQRRVEGGDWITVADDVPLTSTATVVDLLPSLNGVNYYRAVVQSILPSWGYTSEVALPVHGFESVQSAFVNWGVGYATVESARCEPRISETVTRARSVVNTIGRSKPVLLVGNNTAREVDVAFVVSWGEDCGREANGSTRQDWLKMGEGATSVVYRDWTGRRIHGALGTVTVADMPGELDASEITFTITETDTDDLFVMGGLDAR